MPIPEKQSHEIHLTAKERIYNTLKKWIIDGTLLPEERLSDANLAQYFSVSRTPVREALQMLSEQKLVYVIPSSGTFVSPIDTEDMKYIYQMLGGIQAFSLELGLPYVTEDDIKTLVAANESLLHNSKYKTAADVMEADSDFHRHLSMLSKNPYIVSTTDNLMVQAHRNEIRFFKANETGRSYEDHKKIICAIKSHDLRKAQELVKLNWQMSVE